MIMTKRDQSIAIIWSAVILAHARAGNWEETGHQVAALAHRFDGPGLQILITGLADTLTMAQGGHAQAGEVCQPVWVDPDGTQCRPEEVERPEIVWAGRFVAARAALDEDACAALVNSCAADPRRYTDNILAVLEVTAVTLNAIDAARI